MLNNKLGLPYMGSKRKLASEILKIITQRHTNITDFYDLCGGGGSVSFTAVKEHRFNVHYNELNKHIYSLVKYLKENKTLEPKFYEWVTREEFFKQIKKPNEDADWYSGFVMSCWSFGNNSEKGYMYGAHIEESKRLAHELIVNCDLSSMEKLNINIPELINIKEVNDRRIVFCDYMKKQRLYRDDITHLSNMQNLQYIQHLQNLQNLQITNNSYENVVITGKNPVIYLDIPYKGTGEYKKKKGKNINNYNEIETRIVTNIRYKKNGDPYEYTRRYPVVGQGIQNDFDHNKFYEWFANYEHPAYLSEYDAPFEQVHAFTHRSSLSATNNKKKTIEKLFWNGRGNPNQTKLF